VYETIKLKKTANKIKNKIEENMKTLKKDLDI